MAVTGEEIVKFEDWHLSFDYFSKDDGTRVDSPIICGHVLGSMQLG